LRHASCWAKLLQFLYMPAIATEMFFILLQSFTITCFGPCGPSSGETQHQSSFYDAINTTMDLLFCDCLYMWCELFYTYFTVFCIMLQLELKLKLTSYYLVKMCKILKYKEI
jgi:hypothetical protein